MLSPGSNRCTQSAGNLRFKRNKERYTQFFLKGTLHSRIFCHTTDEYYMIL